MSEPIPSICPELGREVAISEIDLELKKLWEQDEARTNASLMNLVVYAERTGSLLENSRIINGLTQDHACRAILVEIDRSEEASLRAWITAHCHLAQGRKSVCCEQISFRLTGRVRGRFRNTVFSHLNSDLPLIFWWQGELNDVFTERLASVMDRLIVDSSAWTDAKIGFQKIAESSSEFSDLVVQDLAWTRCWQYRVSIAALFEDSVALNALPELSNVSIQYGYGHRNTALQMLSWLAVQAGWKHLGDAKFEAKNGQKIVSNLSEVKSDHPLKAMELQSSSVTVRASREEGSTHLLREISADQYQVSSLAPADPDDSAELVAQQLSRGGKNSLFLKILPIFLELV